MAAGQCLAVIGELDLQWLRRFRERETAADPRTPQTSNVFAVSTNGWAERRFIATSAVLDLPTK
jgi:hypothetical protein